MTDLLPFLISGLVAGSLYGLAGLGLVLTYRTSGVFNFGHGAIAAAAAFVFYTLRDREHLPWQLAALITILLFAVVVGTAMELVTRPLATAPDAVMVAGTVGVLLLVEGVLYLVYGDSTRTAAPYLPQTGFHVGGVLVSWAQLTSFGIAVAVAVGLFGFLRRTRTGVAMRAVVDNPRLLDLTGQPAERVRRGGWALGCGVAALAGILLAPVLNLDVNLLTLLVIQAFGACAIGAFSSLPLTFLGGLFVGVLASFATKWFVHPPWSGIAPSVPFLVLIVVLLLLPANRLPGSRFGRRTLLAAPLQWSGVGRAATSAVVVIGLLVVPQVVGTKLPVWTTAMAYVLVFTSLGLLTWGSGQLSLCHGAFLALGATTMAHLTAAHVPWLPALAIAGLATVPAGAVVAIPAIRLTGLYLALATLGFAIFMQDVLYPSSLMFGLQVNVSVPRPHLGAIDGGSDTTLYYLVLGIVAVLVVAVLALHRSRFGRLLAAMAESPTMLATHGLNVSLTRLMVFCLSAFLAGVGGALAVTQTGSASGVTFGPVQSLLLVAVLGICGTSRLASPLAAALLFAVLPGYVSGWGVDQQLLAFGVAALVAAGVLANRDRLASWIGAQAAGSEFRRQRSPGPAPWPARRAGWSA
ncbi:MAG TPA: ABC transporter permease [Mycobacteriales bacterium]|nr:ABC transporter permease [Mycobacteriales bacterium]